MSFKPESSCVRRSKADLALLGEGLYPQTDQAIASFGAPRDCDDIGIFHRPRILDLLLQLKFALVHDVIKRIGRRHVRGLRNGCAAGENGNICDPHRDESGKAHVSALVTKVRQRLHLHEWHSLPGGHAQLHAQLGQFQREVSPVHDAIQQALRDAMSLRG